MNPKCVTYVPAHPLPLSPVYTPGESWGEGINKCNCLILYPLILTFSLLLHALLYHLHPCRRPGAPSNRA